MPKIGFAKIATVVAVFCAVTSVASRAQTFTLLTIFNQSDGGNPTGSLVQGTNGNFYGTTRHGGNPSGCANRAGCGTVYELSPAGQMIPLYKFSCTPTDCGNGKYPAAGMLMATNGNFYGTTSEGGSSACAHPGCGTVFEVTRSGTFKTLHQLIPAEGSSPNWLTESSAGSIIGTASSGGAHNGGTIFEIAPSGTFVTLYSFCSVTNNGICSDGALPNGLIQASDGDFYGTTAYQGGGKFSPEGGTIFRINPAGKLTTLYSFCSQVQNNDCLDGELATGLVQSVDGNFYGTTTYGGINKGGTVFKITPAGALTTLYSFCAALGNGLPCPNGSNPGGPLMQGTDGNFYGATGLGGISSFVMCGESTGDLGCGTIFEITPTGKLITLYAFCSLSGCSDGGDASFGAAGLFQSTNGAFYGNAYRAGNGGCFAGGGCGTVFNVSTGLEPFVRAIPNFGHAGQVVTIVGYDFGEASSVTFNGTPAKFTVNPQGTAMAVTVPSGASTGAIQVVTATNGTLSSDVAFQVK